MWSSPPPTLLGEHTVEAAITSASGTGWFVDQPDPTLPWKGTEINPLCFPLHTDLSKVGVGTWVRLHIRRYERGTLVEAELL